MASKTPTMPLSTSQARAVAEEMGIALPMKDNGRKEVGNLKLRRLPKIFRGKGKNAVSYRLSAPTANELNKFFDIANKHGKSVCITYKE
jgi:hypothetical protein